MSQSYDELSYDETYDESSCDELLYDEMSYNTTILQREKIIKQNSDIKSNIRLFGRGICGLYGSFEDKKQLIRKTFQKRGDVLNIYINPNNTFRITVKNWKNKYENNLKDIIKSSKGNYPAGHKTHFSKNSFCYLLIDSKDYTNICSRNTICTHYLKGECEYKGCWKLHPNDEEEQHKLYYYIKYYISCKDNFKIINAKIRKKRPEIKDIFAKITGMIIGFFENNSKFIFYFNKDNKILYYGDQKDDEIDKKIDDSIKILLSDYDTLEEEKETSTDVKEEETSTDVKEEETFDVKEEETFDVKEEETFDVKEEILKLKKIISSLKFENNNLKIKNNYLEQKNIKLNSKVIHLRGMLNALINL